MIEGPSQDPETRAQAQAEWRALKMTRPAAAVVILATVAVVGMVWLATGHYRGGLITLVIIGVLTVPTIEDGSFADDTAAANVRNMHERSPLPTTASEAVPGPAMSDRAWPALRRAGLLQSRDPGLRPWHKRRRSRPGPTSAALSA